LMQGGNTPTLTIRERRTPRNYKRLGKRAIVTFLGP
jgi:hypothetical protein